MNTANTALNLTQHDYSLHLKAQSHRGHLQGVLTDRLANASVMEIDKIVGLLLDHLPSETIVSLSTAIAVLAVHTDVPHKQE